MKKLFCFFSGILLVATAQSQTSQLPVRLAIVAETPDALITADALTVEFSKNEKVQLLERAEIEKIYREQGFTVSNKDYLKLGQILGADGLLLLETRNESKSQLFNVRLVAVKPGVVLEDERFDGLPDNNKQWAAEISTQLAPLLPKLGVLPKDAVPISVVNLRSAIQSEETRELERQITSLAIQRLSQEKQIFVLERQHLQLLSAEKELKGLDESAFWSGSYLLDGTLDKNGYAKDMVTLSARLTPPKGGGAAIELELNGSRTNLTAVVNQLASGILASLQLNPSSPPWNPADEAGHFFKEAQWALTWKLYLQAQQAAESAWALGEKSPDAARVLVRAYAESLPERGINPDDLPVLQIPNANAFAPLDRGLDFFTQNGAVLFADTDSAASFRLGLRLLRPAFGLLESYYYAAEMREDHADQLVALREKIRRAMGVMDKHIPPPGKLSVSWNDPGALYAKLKWNEGGAAYEQPEDALSFYSNELGTGTHQENLPRIIGWTWPARQRVSAALRRLVDDVRASTNTEVRLEGLYLALLLAPDDEQDSLRHAEEELESAMWQNRSLIFSNPEYASLLERTRLALCHKEDYSDINHSFPHEPFASFKHRLRLDFLAHGADADFAVLEELFPNTNEKMETPEQARELLPLMEAWQQRQTSPQRLKYKLSMLRRNAGIAEKNPQPLPPAAAQVLAARFVPWQVAQDGVFSGRQARFSGMVFRNGRLWVRVAHVATNGVTEADPPASFLAVDPQLGAQEEIIFPEKFGAAGVLFEVSGDGLFVETGGHLCEYRFREKSWSEISVPMEGATKLVWLNGRLFVGRSDGLLAVEPESKTVQLLVSTRRTPVMNKIDPLWTAETQIFPQADGRLGALAGENFLVFDPVMERWNIRPLPLTGTNAFYKMSADYFSADGVQRLLTGPFARRYLVGFWNDGPAESLLMEETGIPVVPPAAEKLLCPPRWDWPKDYPMEHSQMVADDGNLWVLTPCKTGMMSPNTEPVKFSDARNATLFCFTPTRRAPLAMAVHFPVDALANSPHTNGHPTDILEPSNFGYMSIFQRLYQHVGNMAFWLHVPSGLVFGGPNFCGHWFISNQDLTSKLQTTTGQETSKAAN